MKSTVQSYTTGFVLSLVLTLAAYFIVVNDVLTGRTVVLAIAGLAIAQLLVQLIFFLHIHRESKPRLNLLVFSFMLLVVGIVVIGSLWIMENLNYNMLPHEVEKYIQEEESIQR